MSDESKIILGIYEELAEILDKIPNAFAKTEDETYLKILEQCFTPQEAFIASKLKLSGQTVHHVSLSTSVPEDELKQSLESMYKKNVIRAWNTEENERNYALMPYIVGFFEGQLDRMEPNLARLSSEYFAKSKLKGLFDTNPPLFKIIPINKAIKSDLEIFPYENAEKMLNSAKSWGIRDCICKKVKEQVGQRCNYPMTVCITFSSTEHAFDTSNYCKAITKEEALGHIKEAEEAGLIHSSMNIRNDHSYICNCCTCCCGVLQGLTKLNQPYAFVKSNYIASIDNENCIGCDLCVDRCQFNAISNQDGTFVVDKDKCIGCGVCTVACPNESLILIERPEDDRTEPPENVRDWTFRKAKSRGIDLREIW